MKVMIGWGDGGSVRGEFMQSMLELQAFEHTMTDELEVIFTRKTGLYVQQNRNEIVREFLASGADWLLQLDGDESFQPQILRMILRHADAEERPIIVGLYTNLAMLNDDPSQGAVTIVNCIYGEVENGAYRSLEPPKTLEPFQVDAAGTGVMLCHRSVFEKIEYPWFWVEMFEPTDAPPQFMNEDIAFCRRAREAGFEIWCDPLAEVMHWKTLPLLPSTMRDYLLEADKVFTDMSAVE